MWDWWHPKLRQLTFHAGASWEGIEERKGLQFVALAREIEGAVPVFDFWHSRLRQLTFHTGEPWEHEERKGLQFWAFPDPGPGRVPVFDYWHPKLRQLTFHTGMPWEDEERKGLQFYAYPPPAARSKLEAYVEALDAPRPAHHAAADEDWVMTTRADAEIPLAAAVAVSSDNRQALVERGEKISGRRCGAAKPRGRGRGDLLFRVAVLGSRISPRTWRTPPPTSSTPQRRCEGRPRSARGGSHSECPSGPDLARSAVDGQRAPHWARADRRGAPQWPAAE